MYLSCFLRCQHVADVVKHNKGRGGCGDSDYRRKWWMGLDVSQLLQKNLFVDPPVKPPALRTNLR